MSCVAVNNKNYENIIDALVYNTPIANLPGIIFFNMLFNQEDRRKRFISAESGYGTSSDPAENICSACTNFILHPELKTKCLYGHGITFGVLAFGNTKPNRFFDLDFLGNMCTLVFSKNLLQDQYYHVNTQDNQGFYIYDGKSVDTLFLESIGKTDNEINITYNDETINTLTPEIYFETFDNMECLVENSISLEYCIAIGFLNEEQRNVYSAYLDQRGINSYIIDLTNGEN